MSQWAILKCCKCSILGFYERNFFTNLSQMKFDQLTRHHHSKRIKSHRTKQTTHVFVPMARVTAQVSSNGSSQPTFKSVKATEVPKYLAAGTISLASQTADNNKAETLSGTATTSGNETYTYQWGRSNSSRGPFMGIHSATSVSYTAPVVTATTYYRRIDSSNGATVTTNMIIIKYDQGQ